MRFLHRHSFAIAASVAVALCVAGAFQHELWTPDEPREAEIGREMLLGGFSAVPTLGGEPFLEKPPLSAWLIAASFRVFGVSAAAARIPAVLASIAAAMVAYALGRRAGGRLAGLASAVALVTLREFADTSHRAAPDALLVLFVAVGHLGFLTLRDRGGTALSWRSLSAIAAACGLSFLAKGPIGPVLVAVPPLVASLVLREGRLVAKVAPAAVAACVAGVVLVALPWAAAAGWDAVRACVIDNTLGRAFGGAREDLGFGIHESPPWFWLTAFPSMALPWTLALPAVVRGTTLRRDARGGRALFLGLAVLAGLALLSIPSGKRPVYAAPLLPAAAAVAGVWLSRIGTERGSRWDRATLHVLLGVVALAAVGAAAALVVSSSATAGIAAAVAVGIAAAAGVLLVGWRARRWSPNDLALATCGVLLGAFVASAALVRPLLGAEKDLSGRAAEVARATPGDEDLLGLYVDETTVAVLPFYTGRVVRQVDTARAAVSLLDEGGFPYVLVPERDVARLGPLRRRLTLVTSVPWSRGRNLLVFRDRVVADGAAAARSGASARPRVPQLHASAQDLHELGAPATTPEPAPRDPPGGAAFEGGAR